MSAVSLRVHVRLPNASQAHPAIVEPATFDRLRELLPANRWEPMLTEADGQYRAWLRAKHEHQVPSRIFGRPASTAEAAVEELIRKVQPWAHAEAVA